MRFVEIKRDGSLALTQQLNGSDIPKYAILSHTWGSEEDEVSFRDLLTEARLRSRDGQNRDSRGRKPRDIHPRDSCCMKSGHRKIQFCCWQAQRDNLRHFWIDTCCIDQKNRVEVDEAVNSMWQWYRDSTKCYVFLSDVEYDPAVPIDIVWKSAGASRWFTRGWMLQELLAPRELQFFDRNGVSFYSKTQPVIHKWLSDVTGTSAWAFAGHPLRTFGVRERFMWASQRGTKREEDAAYCLLDIFDIRMRLRYGEGMASALARLYDTILKRGQDNLSVSDASELEAILRDFREARLRVMGYAPELPGISRLQTLGASSTSTSTIGEHSHSYQSVYGEPWQRITEGGNTAVSEPSSSDDEETADDEEETDDDDE